MNAVSTGHLIRSDLKWYSIAVEFQIESHFNASNIEIVSYSSIGKHFSKLKTLQSTEFYMQLDPSITFKSTHKMKYKRKIIFLQLNKRSEFFLRLQSYCHSFCYKFENLKRTLHLFMAINRIWCLHNSRLYQFFEFMRFTDKFMKLAVKNVSHSTSHQFNVLTFERISKSGAISN